MATTTNKDYYAMLGVKKTATPDDIRKAFRKAARKYHPDVNPGDKKAEEKFKEISEANDILSDEKKRKIYDQVGFYSDQIDPATGRGLRAPAARGRPSRPSTLADSTFPVSRAASRRSRAAARAPSGWGSFKDIFSGIFTGAQHPQPPRGPQPGTDLEYQATVDFWTAIRGGQARIQINRQEVCPSCHGQAHTGGSTTCTECHGTGQVTQMGGRMKFNITCPSCNGTGKIVKRLRELPRRGHRDALGDGRVPHQAGHARRAAHSFAGQRQRRRNGGPAGDLFLIVRTGPNPVFTRQGDDIHLTVPVTVAEASLGAKVEVPTIDGRAQLKIPPGTQSGQKLRMRERGVENAQHPGQRGDEIVTVDRRGAAPERRAQPRDHARARAAESR